MANQQSLTTAMDSITLIHNSSSKLPVKPMTTPPSRPRAMQDRFPPSRVTESEILGQWEGDHFGTGQPQERSTPAEWQDFAQENTPKTLPSLKGRNYGAPGVSRKENWSARPGHEKQLERQRVPNLPTNPQLPAAPTRGPAKAESRSRPYEQRIAATDRFPQDVTLRKRKSENHDDRKWGPLGNTHQPKRASPDRPSPISAVLSDDVVSNEIATTGDNIQRSRKESFDHWVSSRTRPHVVAPNGTTIIPSSFQTRKPTPRYQSFAITLSEDNAQIEVNSIPKSQSRGSSLTRAPPSLPQQTLSLPQQRTPNTAPCTPVPTDTLITSSPPKSRAKTTDDIARRLIFAGIGAGRVPKRTEEELKQRQEEQEKRRVQREEREKLGKEEVRKWCGLDVVKPELKLATQSPVKKDLIQTSDARYGEIELTRFKGNDIQW